MPIEPHLWMTDPPASSWPSCLAVKAAELQSPAAADLYLRRVRETAMVEGRNIARPEVLLDVAAATEADRPDLFDAGAFAADLDGREAWRAFQEDRKEARFRGVGRFPCLMIQPAGAPPVFLVGWRPYPDLQQAVAAAAPDIGPERRPGSAEAYRTYWARLSERELSEATGPDLSPALAEPPVSASSGSGA
jgi:predicted DsbA family dithiol-disulfide isomerase